ncbi:MAG: hypothetical protein BWZ02_02925 [Lentisphaerae bacterium ADurb.BinA184]|nr:MAG: hypothetical protein BWZ02_02925 [Lentisphaerae bacterium ADurb.BinA184]
MSERIEQLANLFRNAAAAAVAADPGEGLENDGGTCNMDTPAFRLPGVPASVVAEASTSAGVPAESFRWFGGKVWYWLRVPLHGQANRRSTMMTAAQRVLDRAQESGEVAGLESCGYYQMD